MNLSLEKTENPLAPYREAEELVEVRRFSR